MSYAHRYTGQEPIRLTSLDPDDTADLDRAGAQKRLVKLGEELSELQKLFYAASRQALLVILQGLDTSGKDGAIRKVFRFVGAQGVRVEPFRAPTEQELAHDFLWRAHRVTPATGMIGVFNRSYYEDVLAVRVRELAPEDVWRKRYEHINAFERLLLDSKTLIVKCYLHISHDEQEKRLLARERDVTKAWKLSPVDWHDRRAWDAYIAAYEEALCRCATEAAPWHILAANRKWFRNLALAELLVETLRPHRDAWLTALTERSQHELAAIEEARQEKKAAD